MNNKRNLNIDIDAHINSFDEDITNQSIDNNIKNKFNTDGNARPAIRKTKTTKAGCPHKQKQPKKTKTAKKIKKSPNKNEKKVKFTDKIDIIKVECWKKYNLEQTADECEFIDDYLDDFESGSKACCAGGVTTFIDFVTQEKGHSLFEDLEARRKAADPKVYVDYSLHMGITDFVKPSFEAIPEIIRMGIPSFKVFMAYSKEGWMASEADLMTVLEITRDNGGVMGVHAENQSIIDKCTEQLIEEGRGTYKFHGKSRPHCAEVEALKRVLYLAEMERSPLHIFHLTTGEGARLVSEYRGKGVAVTAETCPHYLLLDG